MKRWLLVTISFLFNLSIFAISHLLHMGEGAGGRGFSGLTLRDSLMRELKAMPDDSLMLKQAYIWSQENLDRFWALEMIDFAIEGSIRQKHALWELAFRGSKVRWSHRHHDWERMDQFLREQHDAAFQHERYGNYFSQMAQSINVLNGMGQYEKAWNYIEHLRKDMERAGADIMRKNKIYLYIVEAEYHLRRGEQQISLQCYLDALKDTTMSLGDAQQSAFYLGLMDAYSEIGQYDNALAQADTVLGIFGTYSEAKFNLPNTQNSIADLNLKKAHVYMKMGNYAKMKASIEQAEQHAVSLSHHERANIYKAWEDYYECVKDYEHSIESINEAVRELIEEDFRESAMQMELKKTGPMWAMGKHEEAIDQYKTMLARLDLFHQDQLFAQQSFLDEQNKILHQLQRSNRLRTWASNFMIIISVVMLLFAITMLAYGLYTSRTLRQNHLITRRKLHQAFVADHAKETFMRNITTLINKPLQQVVSNAKQLSEEKDLTPEQQKTLVGQSKKNATKLMMIVNNVLDLSRLEAAMMKYTLKEANIVALTEQAINEYNDEALLNGQSEAIPQITLNKQVDSFVKTTDSTRYTSMLKSLFTAPIDHPERAPKQITVTLEQTAADELQINIIGTMFCDESYFTEAELMTNKVNTLLALDFNSDYTVHPDKVCIKIKR